MKNLFESLPEIEAGWVWLVGAGPGDPGLLTLLAAKAMQSCEVAVVDALVDETVLALLPAHIERIDAGKRGGRPSADQRDISERLIAFARAGKRVLRLKGGDPMIFGRGADEARALMEAGVPFRIVPGISAGIGGLAYAGIPLTQRDANSAVTFVTGHDAKGGVSSRIDWEALAKGSPVLVVYMALSNLDDLVDRLIAAGRPPGEPVALVGRATLPDQKVLVSRLDRLAADMEKTSVPTPAMLVIGPVVDFHERINWRDSAEGER